MVHKGEKVSFSVVVDEHRISYKLIASSLAVQNPLSVRWLM